MNDSMCYDIFVDLSMEDVDGPALETFLRDLQVEEGHWGECRSVTLALASRDMILREDLDLTWATSFDDPVEALKHAIERARKNGRALGIVVGCWRYSSIFMTALLKHVDLDPMIGMLQPRFTDNEARRILAISNDHDGANATAAAVFLPPYYVTPEILSAFFVLTPRGVLAAPEIHGQSINIAYADMLRGLRRRGFRTLVCNGVAVPSGLPRKKVYAPLAEGSRYNSPDDIERPQDWLSKMPEWQLEKILSTAFTESGHPRLLLDCRGLPPSFNGTGVCILGFLKGFQQSLAGQFAVTVLVSTAAAEFHRLEEEFVEFDIALDTPKGNFVASIVLNQPWSVDALRDLHAISCLVMFNMLDTIAWDIVYCAPPGLDDAWRVLGQVADAIFFNSAYSRDRYTFRFQPDGRIPLVVTHHSTAPSEICLQQPPEQVERDPFLLLMGNEYDHKSIIPTLSVLSNAFPYTKIIVVGAEGLDAYNVVCQRSGKISAETIASYLTGAAAIVFPSFYEGFGLPVVEALAYGKTIIVRDSSLWKEIARLSPQSGMLVPFRTDIDLVRAVGRVLHGQSQTAIPALPEPANQHETTWADCAKIMIETTKQQISEFDSRRWLARQLMLSR